MVGNFARRNVPCCRQRLVRPIVDRGDRVRDQHRDTGRVGGIAYRYREDAASVVTALATAVAGGWTIVASVAFSHPTVQHLALASSLAFSGLALVGLTAHELSNERCAHWFEVNAAEPEPDVAAA